MNKHGFIVQIDEPQGLPWKDWEQLVALQARFHGVSLSSHHCAAVVRTLENLSSHVALNQVASLESQS